MVYVVAATKPGILGPCLLGLVALGTGIGYGKATALWPARQAVQTDRISHVTRVKLLFELPRAKSFDISILELGGVYNACS